MTTIERIKELDRLYLLADALRWPWYGAPEWRRWADRQRYRRAWRRYEQLRDSTEGLP